MHQSTMQQPSSIKQFFTVRRLVLVGLMAALVFVFTFIGFDIPEPAGQNQTASGQRDVPAFRASVWASDRRSGRRYRQRHLRPNGPSLGS